VYLLLFGVQILTGKGTMTAFGKLLHEGWSVRRSLSDKVTNGHIESIYEQALASGAIGGKLLGAGSSCCSSPETKRKVALALPGLIQVPFAFECKGSEIICFEHYQLLKEARSPLEDQELEQIGEVAGAS
jgi:D-glycero-alpha-D-manno-heptose-7-phosphate kinase